MDLLLRCKAAQNRLIHLDLSRCELVSTPLTAKDPGSPTAASASAAAAGGGSAAPAPAASGVVVGDRLADAVARNSGLRSLWLFGNSLSADTSKCLGQVFAAHPTLLDLQYTNTGVVSTSSTALATSQASAHDTQRLFVRARLNQTARLIHDSLALSGDVLLPMVLARVVAQYLGPIRVHETGATAGSV